MNHLEYWKECISESASACELVMTAQQIDAMANDVMVSHENFGMAFYCPPSTDRIHAVEREGNARLAQLKSEFEAYQRDAEKAIKQALNQSFDANVVIEKGGSVYRYGGRIEQIL